MTEEIAASLERISEEQRAEIQREAAITAVNVARKRLHWAPIDFETEYVIGHSHPES